MSSVQVEMRCGKCGVFMNGTAIYESVEQMRQLHREMRCDECQRISAWIDEVVSRVAVAVAAAIRSGQGTESPQATDAVPGTPRDITE